MSTTVTRWEPFREMEELVRMYSPLLGRAASDVAAWKPTADISESQDEYVIKMNLPEVKKEDVNIEVDGNTITVTGERKQEREENKDTEIRVESFYGSFARSFVLPDNIDTSKIEAQTKDGVLKIRIPKKNTAKKPMQVEVK
jgi:HSP20 family protein